MTPPKPVEWAKVEVRYGTCALGDTREVFVVTPWEETKFYDDALADGYARKINRALSPLLARAELLDRMASELRFVSSCLDREQGTHLPVTCGVLGHRSCSVCGVLSSYASLPKMPEQGKSEEEKG